MNIAQSLQALMKEQNISSSRLAKELGVHTSTVTNWLKGKDVRFENLNAVCEFFGVSTDYLLGTNKNTPTENDEREYINDDPELTEFLQELATRPEMRMLFHISKGATKEDVEKAVAIIEALRKAEGR